MITPVRRMLTRQAIKRHQAATGDNIEGGKVISDDGSDKSNGEGDESFGKW